MPDDPIEVEYHLTLSLGQSLLAVACALVVTLGLFWVAMDNTKGLRILGLITLEPSAATIFYWILAAACGLFVLPLMLALSWRATFIKQRVAFCKSAIWIPRTFWSTEIVRVPFQDIVAASIWSVHGERVITLQLPGRKFRIGRSWLPSEAAFLDVFVRLQAGLQAREGNPPVWVDGPI